MFVFCERAPPTANLAAVSGVTGLAPNTIERSRKNLNAPTPACDAFQLSGVPHDVWIVVELRESWAQLRRLEYDG
jgi:hypothetical protein